MKVKVNKEKCIICGMCASTNPDVFKFDDLGEIVVDNKNINENNKEEVSQIKDNCPVGAIEEVEEETKEENSD